MRNTMSGLEDIEEGQSSISATVFVPASSHLDETVKSGDTSPPTATDEDKRKTGRLWERLGKESSSRFDQILSSYGKDASKQRGETIQKEAVKFAPTKEEAETFFLNDFTEGERKILIQQKGKKLIAVDEEGRLTSEKEEEEEVKEEDDKEQEEEEHDVSSTTSLLDEKGPLMTIVTPPTYIPLHVRLASAVKNLFIPTVGQERLRETLDEGHFRNFEEEGIYRGEKPFISHSNMQIIRHRLMKQEKSHWFNEAGEVEREDVPFTKPLNIRVSEEDTDSPPCTFVPAYPAEDFNKLERKKLNLSEKKGLLCVMVESISFTNHPLFSSEHRLAAQLKIRYEIYKERRNLKVSECIFEKLKVLRESLAKLKQIHPSALPSRGWSAVRSEIDTKKRHSLYRREIGETRQQWIKEATIDRKLIADILQLWAEIKETRKNNGFQSTDVSLTIHKQLVKSKKSEERKWLETINEEVEERFEEEKNEWKKKNEVFRNDLRKWREQRRERREAKKRQRKLKNKGIEEVREEEVLQMAKDQITLAIPELPKPEAPGKMEKEEIEKFVADIFLSTRRPPGEPVLDFELQTSPDITATTACPGNERQRRNSVNKTKIWLKILINNKLVTQTAAVRLTDEFSATLSLTFIAAVISWPDDVTVEVYEGSPLKHKIVSTLHLPSPASSCVESAGETIFDQETFGSLKTYVDDPEKLNQDDEKFHEGKIFYKLFWKKGEDGMPVIPAGRPPSIHRMPSKRVLISRMESVEDLPLDPNDPRNIESFSKMKSVSRSLGETQFFDLNGEVDAFCSAEELQTSVRLRVLKLRNKGVPEFKALEMVSSLESEVLQKPLERYDQKSEPRIRKSDNRQMSEFREHERKIQAEDLVESVLRRLELQSLQAKPCLTLQDLVQEEQIPDIGSISELLTFLKPRRPLRPNRKRRGQVKGVGLTDQTVNLIIHISRGFNVPVRKESLDTAEDKGSASSDSKSDDSLESIVRPFVEVSFQRLVERTYTSQGSNPTWNQQLILPFIAPNNNFTASSLQTVNDCVFFHLYDEVIYDLLEDNRRRDNVVHHQIEKRWLGSLKIPFSTIYLQNEIEGTFRLDCPTVLLGYVTDPNTEHSKGLEGPDVNFGATHLSVYLTIEPTLPPAKPLKESFESLEPPDVLRESKSFVASLSSRFPQRTFRTHVLDFFGKLVCLTRFIKPMQPPQEVLGENAEHKVERVCWYVSLLPSLANFKKTPEIPSIWANAEQFISLGIGNLEERSVLLTNFFLHLGCEAYLLIGSGIPDGISSYVLAKIGSNWKVFCPASAISYNIYKANCPLKSVYMLVNQENIYANIQKYDDPPRLNLMTNSTNAWRPFFSASFRDPGLPSVQPDGLNYKPVDETMWTQVKEKLQVILSDAFMKWRPLQRTPWNRFANKVLQKLLRSYETASLQGKKPNPEITELETLTRAYKVCGVCIHQEYTTVPSLVEALYSTGIHAIQVAGSEFALAVEVAPYPGDAASVWIYIASLLKKA